MVLIQALECRRLLTVTAYAYEWDVAIPPGMTFQISKDTNTAGSSTASGSAEDGTDASEIDDGQVDQVKTDDGSWQDDPAATPEGTIPANNFDDLKRTLTGADPTILRGGEGEVVDGTTDDSTIKEESDCGFLDDSGEVLDPATIYDASGAADGQVIYYATGAGPAATPAHTRPSRVVLDRGTLKAIGTADNDTLAVTQSTPDKIDVTLNGETTTFDASKVRALRLLGQSGNDTLTVDLPAALSKKLSVKLRGGTGNDTLTGPATAATLIAGKGMDTIHSNSLADHILAGAGRKQIFYANGAQTIGDLKLRPNAEGVLTISATSKAAKDFVLSQPTEGKVKVTLGSQFTSFSLTNITSINVLGRKNIDKISAPTALAQSLPLSQKAIALVD